MIDIEDDLTPSLFEVKQYLDLYVVAEDRVKLSLFTNWILADRCILLEGPSSSGKTRIMDSVAGLIDGSCFKVTQSSDTAPFYLYDKINGATHIYIPELNKCNPSVIEILKDWGEGKVSKRDVTVMNGREPTVKTFKLHPKPFILARADENPIQIPAELTNRVTILNCDASEQQTKAVLEHQADVAEHPFYYYQREQDVNVNAIRYHVKSLPVFDEYLHPGAGYFVQLMPTVFATSRRDFPRYLSNTFGITRYHYQDRMVLGKDGDLLVEGESKKVVLVTPEDMWLNHRIFGEILLSSSIKCTRNEQKVLSVIKHNEDSTKSEIQRILQTYGTNISLRALNKSLKELVNSGYLTIGKRGNANTYTISGKLGSMEIEINWRELREYLKENIPYLLKEKFANEYIERYLDKAWYFVDPFTGEHVNPCLHIDKIQLGDLLELKDMENTRLYYYTDEKDKEENGEEDGGDGEEDNKVSLDRYT